MKKSLVTGGAGFIGSHIVDYLLKESRRKIVVLDDFSSGLIENLTKAAAATEKGVVDRIEIVQGSVTNYRAMSKCAEGCDEIYHLAAAVGVKQIIEQPFQSAHVNVSGAANAIGAAIENDCRLFIASTSQVYGVNPGKCREDDYIGLGHSVVWSYAAAKALNEYLGLTAHRTRNLQVVIGRYFNVFGPRQSGKSHVFPRFIEWALRGDPIQVYGDGNQIRSYMWVRDTAHATVRLTRSAKAAGRIFNIGGPRYTSIGALAERIKIMLDSGSEIVYVPYSEAYHKNYDDVHTRTADTTAMRETISFAPTTDLPYIIAETAKHIREKIQMEEIEK